MSKFIVNTELRRNADGALNHEVHNVDRSISENLGCLPNVENQLELGSQATCFDAIDKAKKIRSEWMDSIDGCYYCANACHNE